MKKTAHIISHSHWDREWYLPFEKHRYYFIKLMNQLIEQFKKEGNTFQSFHLDGQTVLLEDYFAVHPEKREIVKQLIEEKKLYIGPWYVLQDAFLTSSEANIRNLQIGLNDTLAYGHASKIGYFPDTFGIYGQAPQILKQAGIDTAAFGRGVKPTGFNNTVSDTPDFESPYSEMIWKSPDGSSVLGILFANWYSNGNEIPTNEDEAKAFWDKKLQDAEKYASTNQLLFMNGCDHQPLQKTIPKAIETAAALYPDYNFKHSSFDEYTEAVKGSLPEKLQVIEGELRNQRTDGWSTLVNTASSRIYLKQWNNLCQNLLEKTAEPLAAMNYLAGGTYPREYIRFMWKSLMKNHPHDSICGCSVDEVHREMVTRFESVAQMGEVFVQEQAVLLAQTIDTSQTPEGGIPLVVMNTTGWEKNEVVTKTLDLEKVYFSHMHFEEIPAYLQDKEMPEYRLVDDQGKEIHCQLEEATIEFGYDLPDDQFRQPFFAKRAKLSFFAECVPSFGYKTFYLVPADQQIQQQEKVRPAPDNRLEMENEYVHVSFHEDGSYDLTEKQSGVIFHNLGMYEDTGDVGNEYMYKEAKGHAAITTKGVPAKFTFVEKNALRTVLEFTHTLSIPVSADDRLAIERNKLIWHKEREAGRSSEMTTIELRTMVTLEKGMKGPAFKLTIDNQATDHRLRVLFPTGLKTETHQADSIFEIVTRPNTAEKEWENPSFCHHQQRFASLSDDKMGLTVATDGLQEYEILPADGTIAVTVLRSTAELGDWGYFPTPEAQCLGMQTAQWQVLPHEKDVIKSQAFVDAYQYKVPLMVIQTDTHEGTLPVTYQFVHTEATGLVWTSMKVGEAKNDVMIRWFNPSEKQASLNATIHDYQSYKSTILEERINPSIDLYEVEKYEIITLGFEK
ncbi:alpha-mannosidase [Neobacillus sp. MM2021_6]|uniref:alpha-mannosidase n=1 Tax=Bacillaceae TaxID=186817 RepID=UPI00140889B7|nr:MULTISPECIES: alpha-mannosidase [Bacillaceae]MBO0958769.1 alpha-mannosidase [Neobacillus sp. MM2021_6]NHC18137.1 alpha-mannosidase [Bacillus sp. MM2020_4]